MPAENAQEFQAKLQRETEHSRMLALKALGEGSLPKGWDFLESMGYARLLGALCNNSTAVVYVSPVLQHILQVDAMKPCPVRAKAIAAMEPLLRALQASPQRPVDDDSDADEAAGKDEERQLSWEVPGGRLEFSTALIPPFRGYAVFPRMALMNHSCQPSCAIEFTFSGGLFALQQSRRKIQKGSELTISYLDSSLDADADHRAMGRKRRQKHLRPYGFECACCMCEKQASCVRKKCSSKHARAAQHSA
eukprot:TRINITY_DN108132_c0_g1_i1.p1 TRINITY_DN108132_c0_g1~~TRINITY_DN108132_c0_g1_i1.p1  ORF type:complete len:267 (+),score=56.60 TRINITY_DN108132_c0_g1_i1:56-802(+)